MSGYRLTRRGERLVAAVGWLCWLAVCMLLVVMLVAWYLPASP